MRFLLPLLALLLLTISILAQDDDCSALVETALDSVSEICEATGRNQACYGNLQLTATFADNAPEQPFESPGDIIDVAFLDNLQLSVLKSPDEWGIALLKIQANLPDTLPGQNVTMLLFGDVYIENQADALPNPLSGTITASANLRSGPGTDYTVVASGTSGQAVMVDARNEAGDWYRIFQPDTGNLAWIFESLISIDDDTAILSVVDVDEPIATGQFGPMQAFYFQSGVGDSACQEAPRDGILIQTPTGAGTVTLNVNDVRIDLGSTAFLTAVPNDQMTITMLEGSAVVTANGLSVTVPTGLQIEIPLDETGRPATEPELTTYENETVEAVPVENLEEPVEIPEPISEEQFQYNGTFLVSGSPELTCAGGVTRQLDDYTVGITPTGGGILVSGFPLNAESANTFVFSGEGRTVRYSFAGADGGTVTRTFTNPDDPCNGVTFPMTLSRIN